MINLATHPTFVWSALLIACDGTEMDLTDAPPEHTAHALAMTEAGLLKRNAEGCFSLTPKGTKCLKALQRLRDLSLA